MLFIYVHNEKGSHNYVYAISPQPQHHHQSGVLRAYPKSLLFVFSFSTTTRKSERQPDWILQ